MPAQNDISLRIQIEDQGTKVLTSVISMLEKLQDTVRKTAADFKSIDKSVDNLNRSLGKTTSSTRQFEDRLNKLQREFDDVRRSTDRAENSMLEYSAALAGVSFALSRIGDFGARRITDFVQASGRLEGVTQAFTSILGSASLATGAINQLRIAAEDPGLTFEVASRATQRFLAFGVELEDAVRITRNFANAAVVSGTSLDELDRGLQQVAKSIGTGKIEQEDLNSITERFGPIAQNIRREYGTTGEAVTKAFMTAGQSVADFALAVSDLEKQPKASADSLSQSVSNLQNAWNRFSTEIGNVFLPLVKTVIDSITGLLKQFNDLPEPIKVVTGVALGLATAIAAVGAAATAAVASLGLLSAAFGAAGVGAGAAGVAGAAGGAAAGIAGVTASLAGLAPFVIIGAGVLVGLGALATILVQINSASNDAEASVKALNTAMADTSSIQGYNAALTQMRDRLHENIGNLRGITAVVRHFLGPVAQLLEGATEEIIEESERGIRSISGLIVNLEGDHRTVINRLDRLIETSKARYKELRESGKAATDDEVISLRNLIRLLIKEREERQKLEKQRQLAARPSFTGSPPFQLPEGAQGSRVRQPRPPSFTGSPFFVTPLGTPRQPPDNVQQGIQPIPNFDASRILTLQPVLETAARRIGKAFADAADLVERAWRRSFRHIGTLSDQNTRRFLDNANRILTQRQRDNETELRIIQQQNQVTAATEQFRQLELLNSARVRAFTTWENAIHNLRVAQDQYTDSVERSVLQFRNLLGLLQSLLAGAQGTRSGATGVTGFARAFNQFTNAAVRIGEVVAFGGGRLFHDPANDRLAELAGLRAGNIGAIRAARRQNARDFSQSFGRGVERASAAHGISQDANIQVTIPLVVNDRTTQELVANINRMTQTGQVHIRR